MAVGGSITVGDMRCISEDQETETGQEVGQTLDFKVLAIHFFQLLPTETPGEDQEVKHVSLWNTIYIQTITQSSILFSL